MEVISVMQTNAKTREAADGEDRPVLAEQDLGCQAQFRAQYSRRPPTCGGLEQSDK